MIKLVSGKDCLPGWQMAVLSVLSHSTPMVSLHMRTLFPSDQDSILRIFFNLIPYLTPTVRASVYDFLEVMDMHSIPVCT